MNARDITLTLGQTRMAVQLWEGGADEPVLALHGWLDNAASFDQLAPALAGCSLYAPDLAGHGLSSHRPQGADYYIWSYVEEVVAAADALGLTSFSLLGHSMGGAIACLVAALYPQRVKRLALLDSLGPLATPPVEAPAQMRRALHQKAVLRDSGARVRHYPTRKAAESARAKRGLSPAAAELLGRRSLARDEEGWYWCNDRRLSRANPLSMTEEQVEAFLAEIRCPSLLIAAGRGSDELAGLRDTIQRRRDYIPGLRIITVDGGHHLHLDGPVAEVADHLKRFLAS